MGLFCMLCKGKATTSVSLFRFPSDHKRRSQWADVCKIDLDAILPSSRVCNLHFHSSSFIKTQTIGKKMVLNNCAIPSELNIMNSYEVPENYHRKYKKRGDSETKLANSHGKNRDCYICGTVDPTVSRFRFPSNILQRIEWAKFCNIKEGNIKNWYRLCRKHFNTVDMDATLRPKLREGVIPSSYSVENKIIQNTTTSNVAGDFFHHKDEETALLEAAREINFNKKDGNSNVEGDFFKKKVAAAALLELNKEEAALLELNGEVYTNKKSRKSNLALLKLNREWNYNEKSGTSNPEEDFYPNNFVETALLESSEEVGTNKERENFNVQENMLVTPTIQKKKFPRYIGDVTTPDIRTPKRKRLLLYSSRSAITKYCEKVHQLQITNNYLQQKNFLNEIIYEVIKVY